MTKLESFAHSLEQWIGRPSHQRPFVCEGSPYDCSVFIVGANAATEMSDFWKFWTSALGFNKELWLEAYLEERARVPLKPGKKRRQKVSSTRRVLGWIGEGAAPIQILETNVYPTPTSQLAELESRKDSTLTFLLEEIRPKLIITHGRDAELYFARHLPSCAVRSYAHFARRCSRVQAFELGLMIKDMLERH